MGTISSTRSKLGREDIKWQELLQYFRSVQAKHEKARRQNLGTDSSPLSELLANDRDRTSPASSQAGPPGFGAGKNVGGGLGRKRVMGQPGGGGLSEPGMMGPPSRSTALSPLNPRSRQNGLLGGGGTVPPQSPPSSGGPAQRPKRALSLVKK